MSSVKGQVKRLDTNVYEIISNEYEQCYIEKGIVCFGDEEVGEVYYADYFRYDEHIESNDFDDLDSLWEYMREEMNFSWSTIEQILFNWGG